jgi:hypothetical protein
MAAGSSGKVALIVGVTGQDGALSISMSPADFQSVAFGHASYRERRPGRNLQSFRSALGVAIFHAACGNIIGVTLGTLKLGTL